MMPPSPRLLARNTSVTYLSDTTIINVQKIAETPPRMFSAVSGMPCSGLLGGIQRARADIAIDDPERKERERCRGLTLLRVSGNVLRRDMRVGGDVHRESLVLVSIDAMTFRHF
jgi:hypothetical protein